MGETNGSTTPTVPTTGSTTSTVISTTEPATPTPSEAGKTTPTAGTTTTVPTVTTSNGSAETTSTPASTQTTDTGTTHTPTEQNTRTTEKPTTPKAATPTPKPCDVKDLYALTHVIIDIGKNPKDPNVIQTKDAYKYHVDGCDITVKEGHHKPSEGYKECAHTFPNEKKITHVKFHDKIQQGFNSIPYGCKEVKVYFWEHDRDHLLPLLVLFIGYCNKYAYFRNNKNGIWTKETKDNDKIDNDTIKKKLDEVSDHLKTVVLKIDATTEAWKYRINGENNSEITNHVMVTVHGPLSVFEYKRYAHSFLNSTPIRFLSTRYRGRYIPFEDPDTYKTECSMANVYYWQDDLNHKKPLLLELIPKVGSSVYYKLDSYGMEWEVIREERLTIAQRLDLQNCACNNVHVLDISKTPESTTNYFCLSCQNNNIIVRCHKSSKCRYYKHTVAGYGCVSKFNDGDNEQTVPNSMQNVKEVYVHCYPIVNGRPLLIHIPDSNGKSGRWYKRLNLKTNIWEIVKEQRSTPKNDDDMSAIMTIMLDVYSPTIAIDIGYATDTKVGTSYTYYINSEKFEAIKEMKDDHIKITHSREEGPFKLVSVRNGSDTINGIPYNGILDSVCVYFWKYDQECKRPLIVELAYNSGLYSYYKESDDHKTWDLVPLSGDKTKELSGDLLRAKLHQLWNRDIPVASGLIVMGVLFGLLFLGFAVYEGLNLLRRPSRSLILRVVGGWRRFY